MDDTALRNLEERLQYLRNLAERREAVKLLAVAGDEGNGVALVQKADHVFHMAGVFVQLRCQLLNEILHAPVPFLINRCL